MKLDAQRRYEEFYETTHRLYRCLFGNKNSNNKCPGCGTAMGKNKVEFRYTAEDGQKERKTHICLDCEKDS